MVSRVVLFFLSGYLIFAGVSYGATIRVNTLADVSNPNDQRCSLREAIDASNLNVASGPINPPCLLGCECAAGTPSATGPDVIVFDGSGTIAPTTQLPALIDGKTRIDGWSAPNAGPGLPPTVVLDGGPFQISRGLVLNSRWNAVRGLTIINFGSGIYIPGDLNWVCGNAIGTDGNVSLPNSSGVSITGDKNLIGTNADGAQDRQEMNIISGNSWAGILITAGDGTRIAGNRIGTNSNGTQPIPNSVFGINIFDGLGGGLVPTSLHIIGTNSDGQFDQVEGNLISGNAGKGVYISDGATDITIAGNRIGLDRTGSVKLPNMGDGVQVYGTVNRVRIGTDGNGISDTLERNVISGNAAYGLYLFGSDISVAGNYIGLNRAGDSRVPNDLGGIWVDPGLGGGGATTIGGTSATFRNIISGNTGNGIDITADNVTVQCNFIGTDVNGTADRGNTADGVFISGSNAIVSDNRIYFNDVGLEITNDTSTVDNNNIDNATAGLVYNSPNPIVVTDNWWGDPSGPTYPGFSGIGDAIIEQSTGVVTFDPWEGMEVPDCQ